MKKIFELLKKGWVWFSAPCKDPNYYFSLPVVLFVLIIAKPCQLWGYIGFLLWLAVIVENTNDEERE